MYITCGILKYDVVYVYTGEQTYVYIYINRIIATQILEKKNLHTGLFKNSVLKS